MRRNEFKVSFAGDTNVGKTSINMRLIRNTFHNFTETTIGASFFYKRVQINNKIQNLSIWDTAGQERYYCLTPMYFKNSLGIVLVYDITSKESFESIKNKWYPDIIKLIDHHNIILFGNKLDLEYKRQVSKEEAQEFANKNNLIFSEISAKTDYDKIYSCFQELVWNNPYELEEFNPIL